MKQASYEELVWFAHICIRIGIRDLEALRNNVIDDKELTKLGNIMRRIPDEEYVFLDKKEG